MSQLYPLIFSHIYKTALWGGTNIQNKIGLDYNPNLPNISESWDLVDREDAQSIVQNGPLKGLTLRELFLEYGQNLYGSHCTTDSFPLFVKIIDAEQTLSVQIHPCAKTCQKLNHGEPKTEAWYILDCKPNSIIYAGFDENFDLNLLDSKNIAIENFITKHNANSGDLYLIPAGTVHAIGQGNLILEIQQNSDTTFRISDWKRKDSNGNRRQLHLQEAIQCIKSDNKKYEKITAKNFSQLKSDLFIMRKHTFPNKLQLHTDETSFHLITNLADTVELIWEKTAISLKYGQTCLVPVACHEYVIHANNGIILQTLLS